MIERELGWEKASLQKDAMPLAWQESTRWETARLLVSQSENHLQYTYTTMYGLQYGCFSKFSHFSFHLLSTITAWESHFPRASTSLLRSLL